MRGSTGHSAARRGELEEKLHRHSDVEFDGESDGHGPEAQKPYLDPL